MYKNLNNLQTSYFIVPEPLEMSGVLTPLMSARTCIGIQNDLKAAIYDIVDKRPKIIFVAIDHPRCKWSAFQEALENTYACFVVPFVSKSTVATVNQLKMTACEYKVQPPNTPENFLKIVKKISLSLEENLKSTRFEQKHQTTLPAADTNSQVRALEKALQLVDKNELTKQLTAFFESAEMGFFEKKSNSSENFTALSDVQTAHCIAVQSDNFTGHLLTASVDNNKIETEFIDKLYEKIIEFLKTNPTNFFADEKVKLDIQAVHFKDWASEEAQFMKQTVHNTMEVAIGFFPEEKVKYEILDTENSEMSKIAINDLEPTTTIGVNLYLHLPHNQKYIHYVPEGGNLQQDLKDRLLSKGVLYLHFYKKDKEKFKKSLVEDKLNQKIETFNSRKTTEPIAI